MTETGELTRDDLVIDPDMEIDDDGSEWHAYHPTEKEKQLLIDLMEECCQKHHGCSLLEYVQDDDMTMKGGIS